MGILIREGVKRVAEAAATAFLTGIASAVATKIVDRAFGDDAEEGDTDG